MRFSGTERIRIPVDQMAELASRYADDHGMTLVGKERDSVSEPLPNIPAVSAPDSSAPFRREERYFVLKARDVDEMAPSYRTNLKLICDNAKTVRAKRNAPPLQCVVVEHDWPEYEHVWKMIKERTACANGRPIPSELDRSLSWCSELQNRVYELEKADTGKMFKKHSARLMELEKATAALQKKITELEAQ